MLPVPSLLGRRPAASPARREASDRCLPASGSCAEKARTAGSALRRLRPGGVFYLFDGAASVSGQLLDLLAQIRDLPGQEQLLEHLRRRSKRLVLWFPSTPLCQFAVRRFISTFTLYFQILHPSSNQVPLTCPPPAFGRPGCP